MADLISRFAEGEPVTFLWMGGEGPSRHTSAHSVVSGWLPDGAVNYFGRGANLMVRPSRADCRAASRICITTTLVSSDVRSPFGFKVPFNTAAR
jgi:hypothetical protein